MLQLTAGDARVDLFPEHGGRIGQIAVGDRHLLHGIERSGRGWAAWGSYPMLPWVNRIPGGVARYGGETITVPVNWSDGSAIHGLAAERRWDVADAGDSEAVLAIEVEVDRYHVGATQAFSLNAGSLDQEIDIVNLAAWSVPVGVGIHPWFVSAPVRLPAELIWDGAGPVPDSPPRPVQGTEDLRQLALLAPMDCCFTGLTDSTAEIGDVTLSWRGPVTHVVVYSGESDAVCVEPQTMATNGIHFADDGVEGTGVVTLGPGVHLTVGYTFAWPPR